MPMDEAPAAVHTTMRKSSPMRYPTTIMMTPAVRTLPPLSMFARSSDLGTGLANGSLESQDTNPIEWCSRARRARRATYRSRNRTIAASSTRAPNIALNGLTSA